MKGRSRKKEGGRLRPWLLFWGLTVIGLSALGGWYVWNVERSPQDALFAVYTEAEISDFDSVSGKESSARMDIDLADQTELRIQMEVESSETWQGESVPEMALPKEEPQEIVLAFAGDVLLSDHVLNAYQSGGGIQGVLGESLLREAEEADLFMVNQEFPFSNRGTAAPDKQFTFRLPPERVSILKEMGVDLVTLANNHALDFGTNALLDTCAVLEEAQIPYVGAGANLDQAKALYTKNLGGYTVGFLGATRVIPVADWAASRSKPGMLSTYDPSILLQEIQKGKEICDYLVVYVHWGVEREEWPKEYQRQLGFQFLDAGADLVIGSHPHVLQGIEYYNGKPIVYSLGNFVFGSSIPRTVLLKAAWDGARTRLSVVPATSSGGYTREITQEEETRALFQHLEDISFHVLVGTDGEIREEVEQGKENNG